MLNGIFLALILLKNLKIKLLVLIFFFICYNRIHIIITKYLLIC